MAKIKVIKLTDQQRLQLGRLPLWQEPCLPYALPSGLLKSKVLTSKDIAQQTEMTHISFNSRVKRFQTQGIKGLERRPRRGRKPIMDCSDEEVVYQPIENDRQSMMKAKDAWQQATGKEVAGSTFRFFYPHWREI